VTPIIPPSNPFEYELYEAKQLARDRLFEKFRQRYNRFHEPTDEEIAAELARRKETADRNALAEEMYPALRGAGEACREAKRVLLQDQLDWLEAERVRLQEEQEQLDNPEWTYDDAMEDFAKRFLTWIESRK